MEPRCLTIPLGLSYLSNNKIWIRPKSLIHYILCLYTISMRRSNDTTLLRLRSISRDPLTDPSTPFWREGPPSLRVFFFVIVFQLYTIVVKMSVVHECSCVTRHSIFSPMSTLKAYIRPSQRKVVIYPLAWQ